MNSMAHSFENPLWSIASDTFVSDALRLLPTYERPAAESLLGELIQHGFSIVKIYGVRPTSTGKLLVLFPFTPSTLAVGQIAPVGSESTSGPLILDRLLLRNGHDAATLLSKMRLL
jgi:hypothetical protein